MKLEDIRIRDPFILADRQTMCYYLYGTANTPSGQQFSAYRSKDLINFEFSNVLFKPAQNFWADRDFWAPEVHFYKGRYYMFASFKSENRTRCTQALVCDTPDGCFKVHSKPLTPKEWECLDGSLFVDGKEPYMVFCREWLQTVDGEIYIAKLNKDLTEMAEKPRLLFSASSSEWAKGWVKDGTHYYVTDGPFIVKGNDNYIMIWSSGSGGVYQTGQAVAKSLNGKWNHCAEPLFSQDGGHGMIFKTFEGKNKLCLHQPNKTPFERARIFDIEISETIKIIG